MEPNSLTAELETQLEIQTRELAETRKALAEALHNADDCGKDYEGSGTEIVIRPRPSCSASRFTAGAFAFFILSQSGERPER
jgi:hypothetical protein